MKIYVNNIIIVLVCILFLSFNQNCQNKVKQPIFWYTDDFSKILDIESNQWKIYYSGFHNSPIFKIIKTKNNLTFLKCANWFCNLGYGKDTIICQTFKTKDNLEVSFDYKKLNFKFVPYNNIIKWDSIKIEKGTSDHRQLHHTFVNNNVDFKSKSILAWMIFQPSFKFSKVDEKQGEEKFIFLELYSNGKIIGKKIASSLFFDLEFSEDIGFY